MEHVLQLNFTPKKNGSHQMVGYIFHAIFVCLSSKKNKHDFFFAPSIQNLIQFIVFCVNTGNFFICKQDPDNISFGRIVAKTL